MYIHRIGVNSPVGLGGIPGKRYYRDIFSGGNRNRENLALHGYRSSTVTDGYHFLMINIKSVVYIYSVSHRIEFNPGAN